MDSIFHTKTVLNIGFLYNFHVCIITNSPPFKVIFLSGAKSYIIICIMKASQELKLLRYFEATEI